MRRRALSAWKVAEREAARLRKVERAAKEKARMTALVNRWVRRSRGVLLRREARELVERLASRSGSDFVGMRKPGHFHMDAMESVAYNRRKGRPVREGLFARGCRDKFFFYGPSGGAGMWPGDRLVWDPNHESPCHKGAWVVERGNG